MEVRHWSHMGVYNPDLIREFQVHVSKYRSIQKEQIKWDMAVIKRFLKKGHEICNAHKTFRENALSNKQQVGTKEGLSFISEQELGTSSNVTGEYLVRTKKCLHTL